MQATGYALIQFATVEAKEKAIKEENKTKLLNKTITVSPAVMKNHNKLSKVPPCIASTLSVPYPFTIIGNLPIYPMYSTSQFVNQVEIIVVSPGEETSEYGENIEKDILKMGIAVDIMFPIKKFTLEQLVEQNLKEGTIFQVVIEAENVTKKTVDVHGFMYNTLFKETFYVETALKFIKNKLKDM